MASTSSTALTQTLRVRMKDKHAALLLAQSRELNFVGNFDNDLSFKPTQRTGPFMSAYDLSAYTTGAGKAGLTLHSQTIQAINEEYATRRKPFKKAKLRWRASQGPRRALGWIPIKAAALRDKHGQVHDQGHPIGLGDS